ncbi:MAG: histidine kinase [Brachybacterium tyrofermentans]
MTNGPDARTDVPDGRVRRSDPFRWIIENPGTVDLIAFGAAAFLVLVSGFWTGSFGWWTVFSVPMILTGAVCRTRPALGVLVIGGLALLHVLVGIPVVMGDALTFYAMFCAVAYGSRLVHGLGVGAGFLGVLVQATSWAVGAVRDEYGGPLEAAIMFSTLILVGSITIVAIWALASLQRARVRQLALTRDRAEQAIREREQRTALAVADERARIAREMHDVVAHSLSVIIAQADGGRFVAAQKPEKAAEVLSTIGETGRAALADMRSLLGVLRQEDETSFGPQPGPEMLEDLIARVRATGLDVSLDLEGRIEDLPQALGMSVFRLIQESLTNVLKHAGLGASARVRIHRTPQRLEIDVFDDGQGTDPESDGEGHGITGMRERMAVFGGVLRAGPLLERGYRVQAIIPLDGCVLAASQTADRPRHQLSQPEPSVDPIRPAATPTHTVTHTAPRAAPQRTKPPHHPGGAPR